MNTTQKTVMSETDSQWTIDSEMRNLLQMTNEVLLKIKLQTKESSL
ncbi:MAG: hypothetical protein ACQ9CV_04130 [Nitrosopumilus sp.]|jgi:hypothetical protein